MPNFAIFCNCLLFIWLFAGRWRPTGPTVFRPSPSWIGPVRTYLGQDSRPCLQRLSAYECGRSAAQTPTASQNLCLCWLIPRRAIDQAFLAIPSKAFACLSLRRSISSVVFYVRIRTYQNFQSRFVHILYVYLYVFQCPYFCTYILVYVSTRIPYLHV